MSIREEKQALRQHIRKAMELLPPDYFHQAGEEMGRRIRETETYRQASTIFCFVSHGKEPDTLPLLEQILLDGKRLCVPLCKAPGIMEARQITSLSQLSLGAYGIPEPPADAPLLPPSAIHLALIPCLAATKDGKRLGKGGGYYDRFLSQYTGAAFLLCPALLLQGHIPTETHDVLLPDVVTEGEGNFV